MSGAGQLPKPVRIGRLVRWRRADLDTWLVGQSGKGDAVTPTNATAV
jgi:predicted DNA-binding transcriptional regulator AlpA